MQTPLLTEGTEMTTQDAFDEWMAHDEWQFADREACWKFMFEKGEESMRQQLSAALVACKLKDEALRESGRIYCTMIGNDFMNQPSMFERTIVAKYVRGWFRHNQPSVVKNALAIQPDDSALKTWLGEPVMYLDKDGCTILPEDMEGNPRAHWQSLYSPKGLK